MDLRKQTHQTVDAYLATLTDDQIANLTDDQIANLTDDQVDLVARGIAAALVPTPSRRGQLVTWVDTFAQRHTGWVVTDLPLHFQVVDRRHDDLIDGSRAAFQPLPGAPRANPDCWLCKGRGCLIGYGHRRGHDCPSCFAECDWSAHEHHGPCSAHGCAGIVECPEPV